MQAIFCAGLKECYYFSHIPRNNSYQFSQTVIEANYINGLMQDEKQ